MNMRRIVNLRKDNILTIIIVTAVTLLIWVWAAAETRESERFSVRVEFAAPDPDDWYIDREHESVTLIAQGSRMALHRMQEVARRPLRLNVTPAVGRKTLDLLTAIREHPSIEVTGVTIVATEPVNVDLNIDEIERVSVPVNARLPQIQTVGDVEIDPPAVTVSLPRGLRRLLPTVPSVEAVVDQQVLDALEPDVRHTIPARLRLDDLSAADGRAVRIDPMQVRLSFVMRSRTRELTLDSVRVQLAGPPEDHRDYMVEIEDAVLRNVTIRADSTLISRIENREALVIAVLHVSSREKEQRIQSKPVSYFIAMYTDAAGLARSEMLHAEVNDTVDPPVVRLRIERKDAM
jgi:hypothetical protein